MIDESDQIEDKSKSQKKREMHALQALGEALVSLSNEQLARFNLEEELLYALREAKSLKSHGAKRRQMQYIGKLMRSIDPQPIQKTLASLNQQQKAVNAKFHLVESWRDRLMAEGDKALAEFMTQYPKADSQHLRQLIRNAKQALLTQAGAHYAKGLFKYLRGLMT